MAFTYTGNLDTALDRVRFGVGDVVSPGLLADATYTALLAQDGATEASSVQAAAAALAAAYAAKPTDISLPSGLRIAWSKRIDQWNRIASGSAGAGVAGGFAFSVAVTRSDGYTALAEEDAAA